MLLCNPIFHHCSQCRVALRSLSVTEKRSWFEHANIVFYSFVIFSSLFYSTIATIIIYQHNTPVELTGVRYQNAALLILSYLKDTEWARANFSTASCVSKLSKNMETICNLLPKKCKKNTEFYFDAFVSVFFLAKKGEKE